jgi:hypothetical protein
LPDQVAVSIKRHAGLRGRKYQSRIFVSPVDGGIQDVGGSGYEFVNVGFTALVALAARQFGVWVNDYGTWQPCIWHKATLTSDDIVSAAVANQFVRRNSRRAREPLG